MSISSSPVPAFSALIRVIYHRERGERGVFWVGSGWRKVLVFLAFLAVKGALDSRGGEDDGWGGWYTAKAMTTDSDHR